MAPQRQDARRQDASSWDWRLGGLAPWGAKHPVAQAESEARRRKRHERVRAAQVVDVVLALGFDLFFKPKLSAAAQEAGLEVRYARPEEAEQASVGAARVVADVSAPGVEEALVALRKRHPELPILACYPHVEVRRAEAVRALGGPAVAVTRGRFAERMVDALRGTLG